MLTELPYSSQDGIDWSATRFGQKEKCLEKAEDDGYNLYCVIGDNLFRFAKNK